MNLPPNIRLIDSSLPGSVIGAAPINGYTALQIPAYWRAMNFLGNVATFKRTVRKRDDSCGGTDVPHPLDELLMMMPNDCQDAATFWSTLFFHLNHYGNGLAQIIRDPRSQAPMALENLLPEFTCPFRFDADDGHGMQQYYDVGTPTPLRAADVIHLQKLSYDGIAAMNPVAMHFRTLRKASLMQSYVTRFLERGSVIRGSIEIPAGMDDDQVEQIVDRIRKYFTGVDAERDVIVLSGGAALKNASITPNDSQLVQQATLTVKEISMITGVPPQFLYENAEAKYVNTVEQAGQDVVRYTFRPIIEAVENQLTIKLLTRAERASGLRIHIDPSSLLRGDQKAFSDMIQAEVKAGIRTRNEGRVALGLPKVNDPDADKLQALGETNPKLLPPPDASGAAA